MNKYDDLRKKYDTFIYHGFNIKQDDEVLQITYNFEIPKLEVFNPVIKILKRDIKVTNYDEDFVNYLIFHIGLVELISYWKCVCSPNVIIKAGYINKDQINWFKKLYFYGLGEFFYVNDINTDMDSFMEIKCNSLKKENYNIDYQGNGNLIPIGGGKDSVVSLELLKKENNHCFIINPKQVTLDCAYQAGYSADEIIGVQRILDKKIIDINNKGFLNGHTPFSSLVAFLSYLVAYLSGRKNIVLSNESSANEATVIGTQINHQYSKTYEFEQDFNYYTKKYFNIDIKYFSLLRPLSEFQIAMLFSNYKQYHSIFRSCNVGSKDSTWNWCCFCPKCLFVYIILSPFLETEELINIFGEDLFEKEELINTFNELLGYTEIKPFECVGTYEEVRYAVSLVIKKLLTRNQSLPFLLNYFYENYELVDNLKLEDKYNNEHNLDPCFERIVKEALTDVRRNN